MLAAGLAVFAAATSQAMLSDEEALKAARVR